MSVSNDIVIVMRSENSSVVEHHTCDQKVFKARQEQQESCLHQGQLSVQTLISVSIPPLCYCCSVQKILVILPEVQMACYS